MKQMAEKKRLVYGMFVLALLLCLTTTAFADNAAIQITTQAPTVGIPLKTELSGVDEAQVTYCWYVANEDMGVSTPTYTPTAADYEAWIEVAVLDQQSGQELGRDRIYFSPLPVVYIQTEDNEAITVKSEYKEATMFIQGNGREDAQYNGEIQIKGRGSNTWRYNKKPYKLKLDKKTNLFGFGKSKHYVLLANYLDPSLMRNTLGFRLSEQLGLTAVDTTWVDVVFNGEYAGNYQLCEHIRIGKQMVDIMDWESAADDAAEAICKAYPEDFSKEDKSKLEKQMEEDLSWITSDTVSYKGKTYTVSDSYDAAIDISGGYLFELGSSYEKDVTYFETNKGIKVGISKPEYLCTNPEMLEYAKAYLQSFEDALTSVDGYNGDGKHYSELADIDSMVAYWLTMEVLSNEDASQRSRYCYKPIGGKLVFGPAWDFDIGGGSYRSVFGPRQWNVMGTVVGWYTGQDFWKEFVDDPYFQIKAQEMYWKIRPYLSELVADGGIIDTYCNQLYESAVANEMLWTGDDYMKRSFTGNAGDVVMLKEFLTSRFAWLDFVFHSECSTTLHLFHFLSANPYIRSCRVRFEMEDAMPDLEQHGARYRINSDSDVHLKIFVPDNSDTSLYINGIFYGKYAAEELAGGISIPNESLTEETGHKNVIAAISVSDGTQYTNYTTVRVYGTGYQEEEKGTEQPLICDPGEHSLTHIEAREVAQDRYGLNESWYCNTCHRYFADPDATELLTMDEVIISPATAAARSGIRPQLEKVVLTLISLAAKKVLNV